MDVLVLGDTGNEMPLLLTLLGNHPQIKNISLCKEKLSETSYLSLVDIENKYDAIFSAFGQGVSADIYQRIYKVFRKQNNNASMNSMHTTNLPDHHPLFGAHAKSEKSLPVFIDLSVDFRFCDMQYYMEVYKDAKPSAFLAKAQHEAVYGLSELQRNEIGKANIIACPGACPTTVLMPLIPILQHVSPIDTIAISCISKAKNKKESFFNNSGQEEYDYHEILCHIKKLAYSEASISFSSDIEAQVKSMNNTISSTIKSTIRIPLDAVDVQRAESILYAQYIDHPFVKVFEDGADAVNPSLVKDTNKLHIGTKKEDKALIVVSTLDMVWKGKVGQAVQNFNIRFNFDEETGL